MLAMLTKIQRDFIKKDISGRPIERPRNKTMIKKRLKKKYFPLETTADEFIDDFDLIQDYFSYIINGKKLPEEHDTKLTNGSLSIHTFENVDPCSIVLNSLLKKYGKTKIMKHLSQASIYLEK